MDKRFIETGENLTIIIPTLNDIDDVKKTIQSVQQKAIKIIIVDGDETANIVNFQFYDNVTYLHLPGSSIYEAMQAGVNSSKTEFVCFFGAGDLVLDIKYFNNFDISVGKYRINGGAVREGLMCNQYWRNLIHHQAAVYRKIHVNFNLNLRVLADYDLNISLKKNGASIVKVNSIFSNIKPHGVSNSFMAAITEGYKIYLKNRILIWFPIYAVVLIMSRIMRLLRWR